MYYTSLTFYLIFIQMRLNFNAYFTNCLWSRVDGWAGPSIFRNIWYALVYISVAAALKQIDFFLGIYGMPYWPSLLSVLGFPDSGTKQPDFGVRWLYWGAPSEGVELNLKTLLHVNKRLFRFPMSLRSSRMSHMSLISLILLLRLCPVSLSPRTFARLGLSYFGLWRV